MQNNHLISWALPCLNVCVFVQPDWSSSKEGLLAPPGGLLAGPCLLTNFDRFSIGGCRRESILKRGKGSLRQVLVALCKIRTLLPPRATNLIKYWSTGQFPLKGVRGKSILLPESFWPELQSGSMEKYTSPCYWESPFYNEYLEPIYDQKYCFKIDFLSLLPIPKLKCTIWLPRHF